MAEEKSDKAKEQYELLYDILGLCEIYYDKAELEYWKILCAN